MGRYPTPDNSYGAYGWLQQPVNRVTLTSTRAWNDRTTFPAGDPRNGNYIPDCNLLIPAANGECGAGNPNFGREVVSVTYDPKVLSGWNVREYSWDMSAGIQQQIFPRVSVEATYVRRSWGNQTITDNRAYSAADFDRFSLTAPSDPRLPNGGGYRVDGLYELKADRQFGLTDNFVTHAKNFGDGRIERYNGIDVVVNARVRNGLNLQGGFASWTQSFNDCAVAAVVPESLTAFGVFRTPEQFCDTSSGLLTSVNGLATYTIPRADVLVAATFSSRPFAGGNFPSVASQSLAANWLVTNGQVIPALGRPMAGGAAVTFVNVIEAGELYGDRISQVDLRLSKILRFGGRRANVGVDIFNLFNTSAVYQYDTTYNAATPATWLRPSSLVVARFAKLSVQFDF
jgi:hypothetical protein